DRDPDGAFHPVVLNQEFDVRTMAFPRICAVIPAHNSQATLGRALASVRAQTLPVSQLIVVDDASTDATADVARSYQGLNAEVLRLDTHVAAQAESNLGVIASD